MKTYIKQKQVVAIFANKYEVVFTDSDSEKVVAYARKNRKLLKNQGAIKVITNTGIYEKI
jgi:hypothetical protein